MSLIKGFTHQTAELKRITDEFDDRGGRLYAAPETIPVRKELRTRVAFYGGGLRHETETYVLTEEELRVGDLIDGDSVASVDHIIAKNGKFLGTEAYL